MPTYIAMLRGINIGPHKRMKMEKLRASCEALGLQKVKTLIQSGNIVFQAIKTTPDKLSKKIEERITEDFGFSADVITRTREEMEKIIERNPLWKPGLDPAKLHVIFHAEAPAPDAVKKLQSLTLPPDQVHAAGKEIYFYFPNGVSGSSIWKYPLHRVLGVTGTMRNWNTVSTLYQMAVACG